MLTIQFNGESLQLPAGLSLDAFLEQQAIRPQQVALVLNGTVVPRHRWTHLHLAEADRLDCFAAVAGG
ncbi:sulfur carrier protein ThiS [Shewanella cyperi]|uniref:Sulfur carrier protein ThiS n=1 Tax=Shewanella cyperi TaxID=2814292 RepID=A0A974XNH8_9GAMM|nr:sulfur carrier protein ThiS [Shewanella cyperi]QSX31604.1 sulfur carrier protein ThiS [Shewanella cyperi]